jgi:hypothetical protein
MNSFLRKMGVPAAWEINDVYGLEPELLSVLPQPVLALLLLFPINDKAEPRINEQTIFSLGLTVNHSVWRIPFLGLCRDSDQDTTLT